jgi:hypothetical protein
MNQQNQHPLQLAVEDLKILPTIDIKGKAYSTVANRIAVFRRYFPEYSVVTNILHDDEYRVVVQTKITSPNGIIIATGLAEEFRRDNNPINTTAALENAETSSIGRALACLSLGGSEYASSFEVSNAITQQEQINQNNNYTQRNTNQQSYQPPRQTSQTIQNNSQRQNSSTSNYDSLINVGLQIVDKANGYIAVYGDKIFENKELIKKHGFHWSNSDKLWIKPLNNQQGAA